MPHNLWHPHVVCKWVVPCLSLNLERRELQRASDLSAVVQNYPTQVLFNFSRKVRMRFQSRCETTQPDNKSNHCATDLAQQNVIGVGKDFMQSFASAHKQVQTGLGVFRFVQHDELCDITRFDTTTRKSNGLVVLQQPCVCQISGIPIVRDKTWCAFQRQRKTPR